MPNLIPNINSISLRIGGENESQIPDGYQSVPNENLRGGRVYVRTEDLQKYGMSKINQFVNSYIQQHPIPKSAGSYDLEIPLSKRGKFRTGSKVNIKAVERLYKETPLQEVRNPNGTITVSMEKQIGRLSQLLKLFSREVEVFGKEFVADTLVKMNYRTLSNTQITNALTESLAKNRVGRIQVRMDLMNREFPQLTREEKIENYCQIMATDGAYDDLRILCGDGATKPIYGIPGPEELGNYKVHHQINHIKTGIVIWILAPENQESPPIILCRGTNKKDIRHIDQNFNFNIGDGFNEVENEMVEILRDLYASQGKSKVPPFVAGHSLGGALAQRVTLSLMRHFPEYLTNERGEQAKVFLYAAPGVGMIAAKEYRKRLQVLQRAHIPAPLVEHLYEKGDVVPQSGGPTVRIDKAIVLDTRTHSKKITKTQLRERKKAHIAVPLPCAVENLPGAKVILTRDTRAEREAIRRIQRRGHKFETGRMMLSGTSAVFIKPFTRKAQDFDSRNRVFLNNFFNRTILTIGGSLTFSPSFEKSSKQNKGILAKMTASDEAGRDIAVEMMAELLTSKEEGGNIYESFNGVLNLVNSKSSDEIEHFNLESLILLHEVAKDEPSLSHLLSVLENLFAKNPLSRFTLALPHMRYQFGREAEPFSAKDLPKQSNLLLFGASLEKLDKLSLSQFNALDSESLILIYDVAKDDVRLSNLREKCENILHGRSQGHIDLPSMKYTFSLTPSKDDGLNEEVGNLSNQASIIIAEMVESVKDNSIEELKGFKRETLVLLYEMAKGKGSLVDFCRNCEEVIHSYGSNSAGEVVVANMTYLPGWARSSGDLSGSLGDLSGSSGELS
ncbi:MAG: hypothetical protein ACHQUC_08975 [Chlamydiales bacterium]